MDRHSHGRREGEQRGQGRKRGKERSGAGGMERDGAKSVREEDTPPGGRVCLGEGGHLPKGCCLGRSRKCRPASDGPAKGIKADLLMPQD